MIEIVINFDESRNEYRVYEPTSDTILITSTLGESLLKLSEFLKEVGMISDDILTANNISYHLDSPTMLAMIKSNVGLLKRLSTAPSGFTISSQRFGSNGQNSLGGGKSNSNIKNSGKFFSNSAFKSSYKKFGSKK